MENIPEISPIRYSDPNKVLSYETTPIKKVRNLSSVPPSTAQSTEDNTKLRRRMNLAYIPYTMR
jgi:hypothetical protein